MNYIQVDVNTDLTFEPSELNGWNVMFRHQPELVRGCPMGRGRTHDAAIADLKRRTEMESPVALTFLVG